MRLYNLFIIFFISSLMVLFALIIVSDFNIFLTVGGVILYLFGMIVYKLGYDGNLEGLDGCEEPFEDDDTAYY